MGNAIPQWLIIIPKTSHAVRFSSQTFVGLMLGRRLRRRPNIEPTLGHSGVVDTRSGREFETGSFSNQKLQL